MHAVHELIDLRCEARQIGDHEAERLFDEAIAFARQRRVNNALALPVFMRQKECREATRLAELGFGEQGTGAGPRLQDYVPTSLVSDERSACPSE